jgi:hypothetical protein
MPVVAPIFATQNGWSLREDSVWTGKCAAEWSGPSGKASDVDRDQGPTSVMEQSHCRQAPTLSTPQARLCGGDTSVAALL